MNQIVATRLAKNYRVHPTHWLICAQVTGPWRRFKAMIEQNPEYAPMLAC